MVIHEANLVDYARMFLRKDAHREPARCAAALAPMADGVKVRGRTPFETPWRTIQLADRVTDLAPSLLGLKLNPPSAHRQHRLDPADEVRRHLVGDAHQHHDLGLRDRSTAPPRRTRSATSISPRPTASAACWSKGGTSAGTATGSRTATPSPSPSPIPTTTCRRWPRTRSQKGVRLIVHNETSGGIQNYERQMDSAFALYRSLGLDAIKSGYVTDTDQRGPLALLAVHGAALPQGDRDGGASTGSCWTSTSRCTTPASVGPSPT